MPDVDKERYDLLNNMAKVFRDKAQELYQAKLGQIEEAYMHYLEKETKVNESSKEMDYSKGIRLDQMDS